MVFQGFLKIMIDLHLKIFYYCGREDFELMHYKIFIRALKKY